MSRGRALSVAEPRQGSGLKDSAQKNKAVKMGDRAQRRAGKVTDLAAQPCDCPTVNSSKFMRLLEGPLRILPYEAYCVLSCWSSSSSTDTVKYASMCKRLTAMTLMCFIYACAPCRTSLTSALVQAGGPQGRGRQAHPGPQAEASSHGEARHRQDRPAIVIGGCCFSAVVSGWLLASSYVVACTLALGSAS